MGELDGLVCRVRAERLAGCRIVVSEKPTERRSNPPDYLDFDEPDDGVDGLADPSEDDARRPAPAPTVGASWCACR